MSDLAKDKPDLNGIAPLGYLHLIQRYSLNVCELFCQAFATGKSTKSVVWTGYTKKTYYPARRIRLGGGWQGHLSFALKHEGVNLEVLQAFFRCVTPEEMGEFVSGHPLGAVQRRVWFLYEMLAGRRLDIPDGRQGGYVPLVDDSIQYALPSSSAVRVKRHHVLNNLIGNRDFAPFIRKTEQTRKAPFEQLRAEAERLLGNYSPELLYRAVQYLYVKETKSSFAIERETPDQRRTEAFVSLLRNMGGTSLTKDVFVEVQNRIVDPRYGQKDWRVDQVYVGETLAPGNEKIHYIAPRPDAVAELMDGYLRCLSQWMSAEGSDPVVISAVLGFAFVFLHPFDDGNGRIHRFVLHSVLARLDFVPQGLIFPVSAVMLKHRLEYDKALETFSRRLMPLLNYEMSRDGEVSVRDDSRGLYRFIDFTPIVEYFQQVSAQTIRTEWKTELDFLQRYDRIRSEMRNIVDMPDKSANQFILLVQQNGGRLSRSKRARFSELSDSEIARLEEVIRMGGVVKGYVSDDALFANNPGPVSKESFQA
jgi:hypothetical protein